MKRFFIITLSLLAVLSSNAREIKGVVKCGLKPLKNVVVTDGENFTKTSFTGRYTLDVSRDAEFVYIVTPSGYVSKYKDGTPQFYQEIDQEKEKYNFKLKKCGSKENYVLIATADPQMKSKKHIDRYIEETIPDLQESADRYEGTDAQIVGIALGDIAWDDLDYLPKYKKATKALDFPFYPVIGNHDHDTGENDDDESADDYRDEFGPNYYAFNLGNDYVIVLDNIIYKGKNRYNEEITDEQIYWVRDYLKRYVPKGSHIIFAMHAPYYRWYAKNRKMKSGEKLMKICEDYEVTILSGHLHHNSVFTVEENAIEHNISAAGGSWWACDHAKDGTPNGYKVFESFDGNFSWYYKSTAYPVEHQITIFEPGRGILNSEYLLAKVWDWDQEWIVEWYQDGEYMGKMDQCEDYSPDYKEDIEEFYDGKKVADFRKPHKAHFFFRAKPSDGAKHIKVVAKDRFGREYSSEINL